MANLKITDLTAAASLTTDDLIEVVDDPGGTPTSKKATLAVLRTAIVSSIVNADVDAAAAIAGTKIAPNFGAQNVVTTGYVSVGTSPATLGDLRLPTSGTIYSCQSAGGADWRLLRNSGASLYLGDRTYGNVNNIEAGSNVIWGTGGTSFLNNSGSLCMSIGANGVQIGAGSQDHGSGTGAILGVDNATVVPSTNPTAGAVWYVESGASKARGSSGTVTTFGPADPHCPKCGTDVGVSHAENDLFGEEIIHCHACELRTGNGIVLMVSDFFDRRVAA